MNEVLKVLVVLFMAVPFAYMFYSVAIDIIQKAYHALNYKARPVLVNLITSMFN